MTIIDALLALVNVVLWCWLLIARPTELVCPEGWRNEGVNIRGHFDCVRNLVGPADWDGTYYDGVQREERSIVPSGVLRGRVYCTGGSMPVVLDSRTVGCQRGVRWQED